MSLRIAAASVLGLGLLCASPGLEAKENTAKGRVRVIGIEASEMVKVPAGAFWMGVPPDVFKESTEGEEAQLSARLDKESSFLTRLCERSYGRASRSLCQGLLDSTLLVPARDFREVHLSAYEIDRHEVTVEAYRRCVRAGVCDVDPLIYGDQRYTKNAWPIVNITQEEAAGYCRWRGKRLPTEAEWEKAARGTQGHRFPWGNSWRDDYANHGKLPFRIEREFATQPIQQSGLAYLADGPDASDGHEYASKPGSMQWGSSPYGAADMAGNVSEWVADYYSHDGYQDLPAINPFRDASSDGLGSRVARGGSWGSVPLLLLSYVRMPLPGDLRMRDLGFRCARSLSQ